MTVDLCATCPLKATPTPLSGRQAELLRFLGAYRRRTGIMPTYSEIADGLGVRSSATVAELCANLEAKGWIVRQYAVPRGISLTAAAVEWITQYAGDER